MAINARKTECKRVQHSAPHSYISISIIYLCDMHLNVVYVVYSETAAHLFVVLTYRFPSGDLKPVVYEIDMRCQFHYLCRAERRL